MATQSGDVGSAWRERAAALARFEAWERHRPRRPGTPAEAFAAAAAVYDWLTVEDRQRPIDVSGVVALHRCLAVLRQTA